MCYNFKIRNVMLSDIINNGERFTQEINSISRQNGLSILQSISLFCEEYEMDEVDIVPLLGNTIKEKIRIEAVERRLLKGISQQSLF